MTQAIGALLRSDAFFQLAAVLFLAAVVGGLALRLRQPLIVGFIAVGLLSGPAVFGLVTADGTLDLLAQMGISLLLFVVGLKLDLKLVRESGRVAVATGLGQVAFTSAVGFGICLLLGMAWVPASYVAVALTFSSTIIIVKLLSDKHEIDALHGRIAVGLLIVQDLVVVVAMIVLTTVGAGEGQLGRDLLLIPVKAVGALVVLAGLARFVLPRVLEALARSPELMSLFGVAWAMSLAAAGEALGFSKEVGAFLAGVVLASTPFRDAIATRLVSLRDFLLLFFFIDLGARLELDLIGDQLGAAALLSLFVLVGNPVIVMVIMGALGYRKRVSFLTGLTVAQISEFSLVLTTLGVSLGHVGPETMGLVTTVGLITIGLSTYLILYAHPLYERLAPALSVFERKHPPGGAPTAADAPPHEADVLLFGLGRHGERIAEDLRRAGQHVVGIDFDPQAVAAWRARGLEAVYGDAEDPDLGEALPIRSARWVISTAPERDVNVALLHALVQHGFEGRALVRAENARDAEALRALGAHRVLLPHEAMARLAIDEVLSR